MSSAVNADMGKDYSINWKYGVDNAINKVTIPQKGIFTITTPKLTSKSLGLLGTRVAVYDAKGNIVWECRDETENVNPTYYIGLNAGNYYTLVEIIYSSFAWDRASTYRFGFEANEYVETEPNSTKETASPIVTDVPYNGWIGSGFAETNGLDDGYDIYKVNLIKGQTYKLICNAEQSGKNTICLWSEKDKAIADHWANITETNAYVAKYTGVHYISVYNYGGE